VLATLQPESGDFVVTGETVNLASRIQNLAPPGGVLIPHDTYRHLRGVFDVLALEPVQVKGLAEPLAVYQVLQAKPRAFRPVVRGVEGIETPLVGRQAELKTLQDALLGAVEEHEGQVITVCGEAGVGKSRLLYEFQNWFELLPQRVRLFQGKARQEAQGLPYALLRDLFAFRFQVLDDDPTDKVRQKLEIGFEEIFGDGEEGMMRSHFLGQLLGYDFSLSPHLERVIGDAEQLRNRGLIYLMEYFKVLCERSPVVVLLEDLHWADDSSLDAVNRLGELAPRGNLLIVGAARRTLLERRPYWGEGLAYHLFIELQPLNKRESRQLVGEILKLVDEIPAELRELVVEGGDGNPFYIEELVKMLVESGVIVKEEDCWRVETLRLEQLDVPPTLAGVLQARLDALPAEERVVLQQASVVGRLFWDQVVAYIHSAQAGEVEEQLVPRSLSALRNRELVYRREESAFIDSTEYLFKHDILREVTYESVLKRMRKTYHALAADWLIEHCGQRIGEYHGLIAEHLLLAERKEKALDYFQAAGESALAMFANYEAESYFRRALDLVQLDPSQPLSISVVKRAELLTGSAQALLRLARHDESASTYREGIELYHKLGNQDREAFLYSQYSNLLWRQDYLQAWQACQEGLARLEGAPDSPGLARLLAESGRTAHFRVESPELVRSMCQRAITMAEKLGEVDVQADALITLAIQFEDIPQSIHLLESVVALSSALGPSPTVQRAHTDLGFIYDQFYIDLNAALQQSIQAAETARQIGDIGGMFFTLFNVGSTMLEMGKLNTALQFLSDFLSASVISPQQVDEFMHTCSPHLLFYCGEWQLALEFARATLEKERMGGSLQTIALVNESLVVTLLELNKFTGLHDLSEAEVSLRENLQIEWHVPESFCHLATVCARSGRLVEAHAYLAKALENTGEPKNNREKVYHLAALAELSLAEESWDRAVSAFEELIEILQSAGYRWRWARSLIYLGDALRQRNQASDIDRASKAYQRALDMFTEMGAPGYVTAASNRLQDMECQ